MVVIKGSRQVTTNCLCTYHLPDNEEIRLYGKDNEYVVYDTYVDPSNYIGAFTHWPTYEEVEEMCVNMGKMAKIGNTQLPPLEQLNYIINNKAYQEKSDEIMTKLLEVAPDLIWKRTNGKYRKIEADYNGYKAKLTYFVSEAGPLAYLKYGPLHLNSHDPRVKQLYESLTGEKI